MSNTFTRDPQPRIQYSGDGSRTTFGFPFPVLASDDLLVFVDDTPATGFAITGLNEPAGGEISFIAAARGWHERDAVASNRGHPRDGLRRRRPVSRGRDQCRARPDHAADPGEPGRAQSRAAGPAGRGGNRLLPAAHHRARQPRAGLRQRRPADGLRPGGAAIERRCQRRPGHAERRHDRAGAGRASRRPWSMFATMARSATARPMTVPPSRTRSPRRRPGAARSTSRPARPPMCSEARSRFPASRCWATARVRR